MAEHTAFSTSGEDAITRRIEVKADTTADQLAPSEFDQFYEIERTTGELIEGDYKRIALQFPDELLHDSVPIYRRLKSRIGPGRELYVLADTSYGSCCVDEVAAQHVDADAMVHYGYACMSQTSRLPVIYVFGQKEVDPQRCVDRIMDIYESNLASEEKKKPDVILLRHDVVYTHQAENILGKFKEIFDSSGIQVVYSRIPSTTKPVSMQTSTDPPTGDPHAPSQNDVKLSDNYSIIYIGDESLGLTNLLMTNASAEVYSYDPLTDTARLESSRTNKLLMRRYAVVQKARDADVFAILVGTLGVASYLPLIRHLRTLLARNRKKSYTISVGKLNPSKLANFLEIECFVLVACPENSLVESKDFLRPIVTPYELEIALQAEQSWTGRYVLSFEQLLVESGQKPSHDNAPSQEEQEEVDPDQPIFSLVTGTYRHAKRYGGDPSLEGPKNNSSAIVLRNQDNVVALKDSAAGEFLLARTYQGLEARIGEDAPSVLEQGRSGIARGYQDDHK
ncbi:putative diphthamide synthesis protein-domain-containing protein [Collybia nuda]|uniref:2-(3-amino-3-carboxypropyl)histidine synthase subunit 2 n=1 Tax=Collybia nuda TaxID=64659 RepID=A0A9P5YH63_9AGAR|nr:putative diphthamide synthesis protein-domain-containing protein [Collybia nuda]